MNIVIIPSWFQSPKSPLNGSFFLEQAIAISKLGHSVTILDTSYQGRKDYFRKSNFFIEDKSVSGVRILSYTFPSFGIFRRKHPKYIISYNRLEKLLIKVMKISHIDILHSHSYLHAGFITSKLAKKYNIPHVMTEHRSSFISKEGAMDKNSLVFTLKNVDKVISVGQALEKSLNEFVDLNNKAVVIPNIVSSSFKYEVRNKTNEFRFISIGSLIERKNFDRLIKSFKTAFHSLDNVYLTIVGDGDQMSFLQKLIKEEKLDNRIRLLGQKNRKEIPDLLASHDAFVLISKAETFGVVYIEALSTGLPVIGLTNGGAEFIINKKNGVLLQNDDVYDVSNALKEIYLNIDSYDRKRLANDALEKYSEQNIIPQIIEQYKEVINTYKKK